MKLLVVMPSGSFCGGAEEALVHLIQARASAGLSLSLAFLENGDFPAQLVANDFPVEVFLAGRLRDAAKYMQTILRLRNMIRRENPDVVLGWMTKAHLYGAPAARLSGIPSVYYQVGLPDGGIVDRLSRLFPAAGALTCSEFVACEQRRFVRHPVVAVPAAVDHRRFSKVARISSREMKLRLGFDPDRPLVGIVGRLQRWKGMHIFIGAMREVMRKYPSCQAVIVGGQHDLEPDYEAHLESVIASTGLSEQIRLVGAQRNIPEWMQAMDVVVHASDREPFGIVVLEAMCLGKPVIATSPGGPEGILTHETNGLLVPYGSENKLAGAILRFLQDDEFARRCGAAARERSLDFTPEGFAENLRDALEKIIRIRMEKSLSTSRPTGC